MTENIHKEIKFESNLGFGTVSADGGKQTTKWLCVQIGISILTKV